MAGQGELTEDAWSAIAPLLPRCGRRGGQWRDLPERYGAWQTCADHLYRWRRDGTWDRIVANAQTRSQWRLASSLSRVSANLFLRRRKTISAYSRLTTRRLSGIGNVLKKFPPLLSLDV